MGKMPFEVSRQSRTTLIDQVVEGLRSAIGMGHYRSGEMLPNLQEMAGALGVSEIVIRRAIGRLAREGLVNPRRRVGIAVCGNGMKVWRGHVLYITWGSAGMYYKSVFGGALSACLHEANVLVSTVHVTGADEKGGFAKVRAELGHAVSLAVIDGKAAQLDALLHERGIPFIHFSSVGVTPSPLAAQAVMVRRDAVLPDLRAHCRACGVRRVLQMTCERTAPLDASAALAADGVTVETLTFRALPQDAGRIERIEQGALNAMLRWLDRGKRLPDLLWFSDDFIARGALLALTSRGIRIPEEAQVVSWANTGNAPAFLKPLTRVEINPHANGETVASCALAILDGKPGGKLLELAPELVVGKTTSSGKLKLETGNVRVGR